VSIAPATRLGQYEVQDFIGQGAMGFVYRAYHSGLERTGAVKVMQALTPDADTVARFRHEAQAIAQLRHPNIVNVYDFGAFEGTPYMIVEYVPGGSLAARMGSGPLEGATALKYLRGIAAGLDYAHGRGVVHRDVKPANVLLTAEDTPVLVDFCLAKLMIGSSLKSMTGATTGTPAYMAPEQVTGSRVGPAADRYSLATIAYELLTGVIPFAGDGLMELLYAQVHRDPPPPSTRNSSLDPDADAVILRGLAKDPEARWESSTAFVEALAGALDRPAEKTVVMREPAAPPASVARRLSRKGLIALVAAALIVALLLAGLVGWAATHRPVKIALSSTTVTAGQSLVVSADNLPPNLLGRIELWSAQYTFPFRAGPSGHVEVTITVPADIGAGDHQVKVCWDGICHAEQTLHVIGPTASANPTAAPSPSPSASAIATPCATVAVVVEKISKTNGFTATFRCFPAGVWTVSVVQNGQPFGAGSVATPGNAVDYQHAFRTPTLVLAGLSAYVMTCGAGTRCYRSAAVTVAA
jgi:hypothetical protein